LATAFRVTGPVQIFVGTGADGALQFLGWSETGVRVTLNGEFEDVLCDIGGPKIGTDVIYQGIDAHITCDVIKYDEAVLTALQARVFSGTSGGIAANTIGALMVSQSQGQRLLLNCPYSTIYNDMIAAYNFLATYLEGPVDVETGTKVKKARCVWRAIPVWAATGGTATLWNTSTTGMPSLD
jgi:hypothetical protein